MWFADRSNEPDLHDWYMKMHEVSLRSFVKNLEGDWEFIFFDGEVDDIQEVFQTHFFDLYDMWKDEECNILYCGPDNMVMKPTSIFGEYDDFRMFNYTDPKASTAPNRWGLAHPHFLNADVRYYPSTMSEDTWELGAKMAEEWDGTEWATEQVILNEMLWSQEGRTPENTIMPHLAYQGHALYLHDWERTKAYSNEWNGCNLSDAQIVHLHGSRNAEAKYNLMVELERLIE